MVSPAVQCFQSATAFTAGELWGVPAHTSYGGEPSPCPVRGNVCTSQARLCQLSPLQLKYILPKIRANTDS